MLSYFYTSNFADIHQLLEGLAMSHVFTVNVEGNVLRRYYYEVYNCVL
jgi:hypothetical protein